MRLVNYTDEDWAVIEGFTDYEVSTQGRVGRLSTDRLVPSRVNTQGFVMVTIREDASGRQKTCSVATLVATAFCNKPEDPIYNTVIHLNGDRADCRAMNLMWRTRPFAIEYHKMFEKMPVRCGAIITNTGERFSSLRELCTTYGLIEMMTYLDMENGERTFPYGWTLEKIPI